MSNDVTANGRSILHKGHGMTHVCAPPDVCKTPSPGGPIPIPYINLAMDSQLSGGAKSVHIANKPVAKVTSKISTSSGDEPGTVGGLISSKFKGAMSWKMGSLDVKAEGKSVVRFLDTGMHNGNSFNSAFPNVGKIAYADDFIGDCDICGETPSKHRVLDLPSSSEVCAKIIENLRAKKVRKRFMVGVSVCNKCGHIEAAKSGGTYTKFNEAATAAGATPIPAGAASPAEMAAANTSNAASSARKRSRITMGFEIIEEQQKMKQPGYNVAGTCAGAQLLARSKHAPIAMTEMFYAGKGTWSADYQVLSTNNPASELGNMATNSSGRRKIRRLLENYSAQLTERTYTSGETVASCNSCQELLYLMMCPERTCSGE